MKLLILSICFLLALTAIQLYYYNKNFVGGQVTRITIDSKSLEGNCLNEPSQRPLSIYLPKNYNKTNLRYPVIYLLHGFRSNDQILDAYDLKREFDYAIEHELIPPVIVVVPNSYTKFGGSFYTNSDLAGKWSDYIAKDVVNYIDDNYRTIKNRNSRGISGHSMGGNGALKIAMLYPEIFGSVYAMSPSILYWSEELTINHPSFKLISEAKNFKAIETDLYAAGFLAMGSTYSPRLNYPPFDCTMPIKKNGAKMEIDSAIYQTWEKQFPLIMVDSHVEELKKLNGIGLEWGINDEFKHLPVTCRLLDEKLNGLNIPHKAEAYEGKHTDKLTGKESRILRGLLPFFNDYLRFR